MFSSLRLNRNRPGHGSLMSKPVHRRFHLLVCQLFALTHIICLPYPSFPYKISPNQNISRASASLALGSQTLLCSKPLRVQAYKHRLKHPGETQKLVGGGNLWRLQYNSSAPPSSCFTSRSSEPGEGREAINGANRSSYH